MRRKMTSTTPLLRGEFSILFVFLMVFAIAAGCATKAGRERQAPDSPNIEYNKGIWAGINGDFVQARARLIKAVPIALKLDQDELFPILALAVSEDVLNGKISGQTGSATLQGILCISLEGTDAEMTRTLSQGAIIPLEMAITTDPRYAIAHFALGFINTELNVYDAAIEQFELSIASDPKLEIAHVLYAVLQAKKGNNELYQEHIETAIVLIDSKTNTLGSRVPTYITKRLDEYKRGGRRLIQSEASKNPDDFEHYLNILKDDSSWESKLKAVTALRRMGDRRAVEPLLNLIDYPNDDLRFVVIYTLGVLGGDRVIEPLIQQLKDQNSFIRFAAAMAMNEMGSKKTVEPLIEALDDSNKNVRVNAAEALGKIGDSRALEPLMKSLSDIDKEVRTKTAAALINMGVKNISQQIINDLRSDNPDLWVKAAATIGEIKDDTSSRVHLRIICVKSQSDANDVIRRLENGESFSKLAKEKSILANSEEGGDIGKILLSDVREEFRIALKEVEGKKYTRIIELGSEFFILYIESPSVVMEKRDQSKQ